MNRSYLMPPRVFDQNGEPRKAGFEFEFGNLPILKAAGKLREALGGELEAKSPFEAILHDSALGKLKIERDANLLKSVKYRRWLESLGVEFSPGSIGHEIESNIDSASKTLVPCEVVTAPIPFDKLDNLDTLVETLNSMGAEGTQHSLRYAFGLHINASIPDHSATTLKRYIQAFLLMQTWITESSQIDITRRFLTKYIDPFPTAYVDMMLNNSYHPDAKALVSDYMEHNPTRNRALDMLPIFCELDEKRVCDKLNEDERELVKGRPAFHYRLPDCKVNVPGWSAARPWNQWVYIEMLASDEALLQELIDAWRKSKGEFSIAPRIGWALRLTSMLTEKFFERSYR